MKSLVSFKCSICNKYKPIQKSGGTGYGRDPKTNKKICYDCCALMDKDFMKKNGEITLYLTENGITNWPGTLRFNLVDSKESRTNWNLTRTDVWFMFDATVWHGYQIGDNTQICHCKRTKRTAV